MFSAACGSIPLLTMLVEDFGVPVNAMVTPAVCLDCDPVCLRSECPHKHGIGMETALMSAALSNQGHVAEFLCSLHADVNAQNEVRRVQSGSGGSLSIVSPWHSHGLIDGLCACACV